eukprot:784032-Pleurochrysis_carterae.AAC.3
MVARGQKAEPRAERSAVWREHQLAPHLVGAQRDVVRDAHLAQPPHVAGGPAPARRVVWVAPQEQLRLRLGESTLHRYPIDLVPKLGFSITRLRKGHGQHSRAANFDQT